MMNKEKLADLRARMHDHKVVNDVAIVELTARELQELLEHIDPTLCTKCSGYSFGLFGGTCPHCNGSGKEPRSWLKRLFGM